MPPPPSRKDLLVLLMRSYPRQEFTQDNFVTYQEGLADVPSELLEPALRGLIRTEKWMPAIAEIRERVSELVLDLPSEADALAQIQNRMEWARTDRASPAPVVHPLVEFTLDRVGGWHAFRSEDAGMIRSQYVRLYREVRAARIRDRQAADFSPEA